jgi:hypothetical protein
VEVLAGEKALGRLVEGVARLSTSASGRAINDNM